MADSDIIVSLHLVILSNPWACLPGFCTLLVLLFCRSRFFHSNMPGAIYFSWTSMNKTNIYKQFWEILVANFCPRMAAR
jgi:hypothetical protein